jgi:hypothetical protein
VDEYLVHDDVALLTALRASQNPWARRVVRRQGFRMLVEAGPFGPDAVDAAAASSPDASPVAHIRALKDKLDEAGIDCFSTASRGVLSTYGKDATLWVKSPAGEVPVAQYTPLYERYREPATLARLYVVPERADEAKRLLDL